ncbi:MAG: LamG-like jellyroll fold domain-containing protein, partial [Bacteroidota bacterium]
NGTQVASSYFHGTINPNYAFPIRIGRLCDAGQTQTRYFSGQIDEVRIWNIAKPQSELLAGYNRHISPTSPGLVGYWNFNIASGTTVPDQTNSGNTGTFNTITLSKNVPFYQATPMPVITANGLNLSSTSAFTYQWNYNGQPIANATTQNYTVTQNGTYTVSITDSIGCPAISTPVIINSVGVQELGNAQQIQLYNGDGYIRIDANNGTDLKNICIYNCGGSVIEEIKNPTSSNVINSEHIVPGVYLVMVMTENEIYRSKIFIK